MHHPCQDNKMSDSRFFKDLRRIWNTMRSAGVHNSVVFYFTCLWNSLFASFVSAQGFRGTILYIKGPLFHLVPATSLGGVLLLLKSEVEGKLNNIPTVFSWSIPPKDCPSCCVGITCGYKWYNGEKCSIILQVHQEVTAIKRSSLGGSCVEPFYLPLNDEKYN